MVASTPAAPSGNRRRKTHNKSRNGCSQCKKRHYKCDEVYPICSNCKRLNSSCSLSNPASPTDSEVVEKQLNLDDLQLLHDWGTGSDTKFSDHQAEELFRQQRGREIELGFQHPYVLHIILAIAALHLTTTRPDESKWYALATSHHGAAIRLARPHIAASQSVHSEAVFNFSCFNSLFSFAEPPLRPRGEDSGPRDYIEDVLDSFRMCRGIRAIIAKDRSVLAEKGAIGNPAWSYDEESVESTLVERYPQVQRLEVLVMQHIEDEDQISATLNAVRRLFVAMGVLDDTPADHSSVSLTQRWAIASEKTFIDLCDSRHPVALVILAHYALLVNKRRNIWFLRRWPQLIMQSVRQELQGTHWIQYLEWPEFEIGQTQDGPGSSCDSNISSNVSTFQHEKSIV